MLRPLSAPLLIALLLAAGLSGPVLADDAAPTAGGSPLVAERLLGFRGDAAKLQAKVDEAQRSVDALTIERDGLYASLQNAMVSIDNRLRQGTTPANPDLVAQWKQAQLTLAQLDESFAKLSQLSATLADCSTLADFLANSVHAALELPGARDDDHRQFVALEASANDVSDHVRRLIDTVNRETDEEAASVDAAHRNLVTLRHAVDIGAPLGNNLATMGRNLR
jgi:hypothetical protein